MEHSERREELKLRLEYVKLAISLVTASSIIFASLQWFMSVRSANLVAYTTMTAGWETHLRQLIDKPDLRPYFEEARATDMAMDKLQTVLAYADVKLDIMDRFLTTANLQGWTELIGGWKRTFTSAFEKSPALCMRFKENRTLYGYLKEIGDAAC